MAGHIRKRQTRKGTSYQARYPDPTTKRKIERTFPTKKEAADWLTTQQHSILRGTHQSPSNKTTLQTFAGEWRQTFPRRLSPGTTERYNQILDRHILPRLGQAQLTQLDHRAIQTFVDDLSATTRLAPGSIRQCYAVLRSALSKAHRLNLIQSNPATNIDLPRATPRDQLILSAEEVNRLAQALPHPSYRLLILMAAYTGARAGELYALTTTDLNLLNRTVTIRRSLSFSNGQPIMGPTKTHQTRTISLPRFLAKLLEEHISRMPTPSAAPASSGGSEQPLLFTHHKTGLPIRHENFYNNYFRPAVRKALPHKASLRFHDLRHTCASLLIAQGAHPKLISTRLGHSSIQITLDRYSHLFPSLEESLADALDALYGATPQPASGNVVELAR